MFELGTTPGTHFSNGHHANSITILPKCMVTTGEGQVYIFPWLVPGFRYERVDVDRFPPGFPASFERYSADLLMLLASNTMLMIGTTWSSNSAPALPLFENFSRVALHLAF